MNKDVNYLDTIHHRKDVVERLGEIIEHPEEVWVERLECLVINIMGQKINLDLIPINEKYGEDFISLQDISNLKPNGYFKAICESPLGGVIYRYNNYNKHEWQLVGIMEGYA